LNSVCLLKVSCYSGCGKTGSSQPVHLINQFVSDIDVVNCDVYCRTLEVAGCSQLTHSGFQALIKVGTRLLPAFYDCFPGEPDSTGFPSVFFLYLFQSRTFEV